MDKELEDLLKGRLLCVDTGFGKRGVSYIVSENDKTAIYFETWPEGEDTTGLFIDDPIVKNGSAWDVGFAKLYEGQEDDEETELIVQRAIRERDAGQNYDTHLGLAKQVFDDQVEKYVF